MTFSVNTNTNALAALETLNLTQQQLTQTQNRVSTGLKVSSAADNASTFAIAQGQRGDIAGFQAVSDALGEATAAVNVALQGATTISNILNELEAKAVQAQDPTSDGNALQTDVSSLIAQIDSTTAAAQFNGVNLLKTGATAQTFLSSLNRTSSTVVSAAFITVAAEDLSSTTGLSISTISVSTVANASAALNTINTAINTVKTALSKLGTASNQITTQANFVTTLTDSLTTGVGDLVDANLAAESANLQALQTKQQLGIQALSIANQGPGAVLSLFR
ncbi:MAG TPA: flagellin [Stellaceae bacterium]|nr:flagellin [Stellaceae bacterium]